MEIVAKNAAVSVWTKNGIVSIKIWNVHHHLMHYVVLLFSVDYSLIICLSIEVSKDPLHEKEGVEIFISPTRCIVEHTHATVLSLFIIYI